MALTRTETTQADWNAGTLSNVVATGNGDLALARYASDDYSTDPISGGRFVSVLAGTWVWDSTNKWIKQTDSSSTGHWGVESSFPFASKVNVEFDMTIESDPSGLVHSGGFLQAVDGQVTGYRIVRLNPDWIISKWDNNVETAVTATRVSNPSLSVGQSVHFQIIHDCTTGNGALYINGSLVLTWNDTSFTQLRPGYFSYGNVIRYDNLLYNYQASGSRTSPALDLSSVGIAASSKISWTATTPTNTAVAVDVSLDGGTTWQSATNGGAIPGITAGVNLSGKSLLVRQTLTTTDPTVTPTLSDLTVTVGALQSGTASAQANGIAAGSARRFVFAVASASTVSAMDWNEHIQAVSATAMAGATMDVSAIRLLIQTLMVNAVIQPGDIVEIDTSRMTVKINGVNALQFVDGDFFSLLPGSNYLEYQDSETQRNVQIITRHRPRWL